MSIAGPVSEFTAMAMLPNIPILSTIHYLSKERKRRLSFNSFEYIFMDLGVVEEFFSFEFSTYHGQRMDLSDLYSF